jgi:hypothetical protein
MTVAKYLKVATDTGKVNSDLSVASQAVSEFDSLPIPHVADSRKLTNGELVRALQIAGIPGASPFKPRSENLAALNAYVEARKKAAIDQAMADWLASKASAVQTYAAETDQTQFTLTDPGLDSLPLPGGQSVRDITGPQLATLLSDCGISGVSHENSRRANLQAYKTVLDSIAKTAADAALAQFARGK